MNKNALHQKDAAGNSGITTWFCLEAEGREKNTWITKQNDKFLCCGVYSNTIHILPIRLPSVLELLCLSVKKVFVKCCIKWTLSKPQVLVMLPLTGRNSWFCYLYIYLESYSLFWWSQVWLKELLDYPSITLTQRLHPQATFQWFYQCQACKTLLLIC